MKRNSDKNYIYWGITAFLVIAASMFLYYVIFHFSSLTSVIKKTFSILMPVVDGLVLAYLLSPLLNILEKKIFSYKEFNDKAKQNIRAVLSICIMLLFIFAIYLVFISIVPQIAMNATSISKNYARYQKNVTIWFEDLFNQYPDLKALYNDNIQDITSQIDNIISTKVLPFLSDGVVSLTTGLFSALKAVFNFVIGLIIAFYVLYNKELFIAQAKKVIYALMPRSRANNFIHNIRFTSRTFINFIAGKICDSIIIGLLCFIITTFMGTPYKLLVSVIVGVTNIIPLFGPYIGAIPSAILIFMVSPRDCLYFIIMIIILQQFDGNILGPKILGSSTGLSGFWVIFAITVFGGWLGIIGWIVGVPVFAVVYAAIKAFVNSKLLEKGLSLETNNYYDINYIDNEHKYIKIPQEEVKGLASDSSTSKKRYFFFFTRSHDENDDESNSSPVKNSNGASENNSEKLAVTTEETPATKENDKDKVSDEASKTNDNAANANKKS